MNNNETHAQGCIYNPIDFSTKEMNNVSVNADEWKFISASFQFCDDLNEKGENKMKLLEIYEDKQIEKIYSEYATKIEKVRATDPRYKEILDFKKKFEKDVVVYDDQYPFNDVIVRKVNDLSKQRETAMNNLSQTMREVRAQLELCETYEQKMAMLRSYNIVDENGVLVY